MAIKTINGNLLDSNADIICHQTNCKGVMKSGVALAIKNHYPAAYESYRNAFLQGKLSLGYVDFAVINENTTVANLCGQDDYGYDGKLRTSYDALEKGFINIKSYMNEHNLATIAFPYKIACCRGGGNWDIVYNMIKTIFSDVNVEIWRLENAN
ncbi:macro domain-containing protein [bacterium]|nr:macro domain-containing protein [bacterium]